jgi:hypothetical protein
MLCSGIFCHFFRFPEVDGISVKGFLSLSFCSLQASYSYKQSVGKEMPISRIVVAVPNATVVLLD